MLILFFRTLILYILVVVVMRLMGKRQIGQLQPFELVVTILIADLVSVPMQDKGLALINGIIPVLTLLLIQISISYFSLKNQRFRELICGKPVTLIEKGKVNWSQLQKNLYNLNDLIEQLRDNKIFNIQDVEFAILETNGALNVLPKSQFRPLTPADLKIKTDYEGVTYPLIMDGVIQKKNLEKVGLSVEWLEQELLKFGIKNISNVIIAILDTKGRLFYQVKAEEDNK